MGPPIKSEDDEKASGIKKGRPFQGDLSHT